MAPSLTPAELTLLGLVVEKPRHGYELEEVITERGMREWTEIGFSSIYYLLGRLRDRGLITEVAPRVSGGPKRRKVYAASEAGQRECSLAAEAAIAELRPIYPPVLVGLANQPMIPTDRLLAALETRAAAIAEKIAEIRSAAERAAPHAPAFVNMIFTYSLNQLLAERQWLSDYHAELTRPVETYGESE